MSEVDKKSVTAYTNNKPHKYVGFFFCRKEEINIFYNRKVKLNYNSPRWRRKREYILSRDKYECRETARFTKRPAIANTVHHIYPVDEFPQFAWEDWNLISITGKQHNRMHDRETGEIIGPGLYWQKRFRRKFKKEMEDYEKEKRYKTNNI